MRRYREGEGRREEGYACLCAGSSVWLVRLSVCALVSQATPVSPQEIVWTTSHYEFVLRCHENISLLAKMVRALKRKHTPKP